MGRPRPYGEIEAWPQLPGEHCYAGGHQQLQPKSCPQRPDKMEESGANKTVLVFSQEVWGGSLGSSR